MSKMRKTLKTHFFSILVILLLWSVSSASVCASGREETAGGKLKVFASILPQEYFLERIGGDRVEVEVLVQPGQDPHLLELTPKQTARLAAADLYFRIGVEFENSLIPRIESTMRDLEIVDCRREITLYETEGEEGHDDRDPHIWLSVRNAVIIAGTMRDALVRADPVGRSAYDEEFSRLSAELEDLDTQISDILAPVRGKTLFVFHPSFGYFTRDYGLTQQAVETGGSEPSARQLARLVEKAVELNIRVIFVQPQFSRKSAETVAEAIRGVVIPIDPLARDYMANMILMARAVEEGLR